MKDWIWVVIFVCLWGAALAATYSIKSLFEQDSQFGVVQKIDCSDYRKGRVYINIDGSTRKMGCKSLQIDHTLSIGSLVEVVCRDSSGQCYVVHGNNMKYQFYFIFFIGFTLLLVWIIKNIL